MNNFLKIIKDYTFSYLKNLTVLRLNENILHTIDPLAFNGLINIYEINLNSNAIEELDPYTFKELEQLKKLRLANNKLEIIENGLLPNTLTVLNLNSNQLQQISNNYFSNLKYLKYLDLSNNPISIIQPSAFNGTCNIDQFLIDITEYVYSKEKCQNHSTSSKFNSIELKAIKKIDAFEKAISTTTNLPEYKNNMIILDENMLFSFGYTNWSNRIDLSNKSIDKIDLNAFKTHFNQYLQVLVINFNLILNLSNRTELNTSSP